MSLVSPGVQVSIIDESQYIAAPTNSVPFIVIATAQNKSVPAGNAVAIGTAPANANNVFLMTSQRELVSLFGNPFFYRTTAGTPIHGYELNEHGLLAAYSVLGVSNRAYVMRADVDLAALTARLSRPTGQPANNTYWLDAASTKWGIFEWNSATGRFTNTLPLVIVDEAQLDAGIPSQALGAVGAYAVVATNANNPVYYKNSNNEWVLVGSDDWMLSHPAVRSTVQNPTLTPGETFTINGQTITVTGTDLTGLAAEINAVGVTGVEAVVVGNRLEIRADSSASSDGSSLDGGVDIQGTGLTLTEIGVTPSVYFGPALQQTAHTVVPRWRSSDTMPRPTGSVWNKLTSVNEGTEFSLKRYSSIDAAFTNLTVRQFRDDAAANRGIDPAGGGVAIPVGTIYAQYDVLADNTLTFKFFERTHQGATAVSGLVANPTFGTGDAFTISASDRTTSTMGAPVTATMVGTSAVDFVTAVSAANVPNVVASVSATGAIELRHTQGGVIVVQDVAGTPIADAGFVVGLSGVRAGDAAGQLVISNWSTFAYTAAFAALGAKPANGTLWYYSAVDEVDIMINDNGWRGYRTLTNDVRGFNLTATDPAGPIVSAVAPSAQSTGVALVEGDIWVDTSDLENYPVIRRWEVREDVAQWVIIDNADQTSQDGIVFADARWSPDGVADPIDDAVPSIASLLISNYVDPDAPNHTLYPSGTLMFNTRRSGFIVKQFRSDWFNASRFPDTILTGLAADTWGSVAGLRDDGSPYMGRKAVRQVIVAAMKAAVDTNTEIREEQRGYNLMAAPGYPELVPNLVSLNNERRNTAFIVGDSPLRMPDVGNSILSWANDGGPEDLTTGDPYAAVFYPACQTTDLSGNTVVQPASHMLLRTMIRSDSVAYPWLAPAGTRRGVVDNAQSLGYIDGRTGEFRQISVRESIRDVLYTNRINPVMFIPGAGITNFGNKTLFEGSAMDRINVARLVAFLRSRLEAIGRQFLFEPNDKLTRDEVKGQIEQLMNDMIAKRALYDYLVVCDESNNTPLRIDRNELWIDIAIEPVKAAEFIYIPVRLRNTGEISGS